MLPTPSTSHVKYDRIYEPAEDSYLLLDTLSSPEETAYLHQRFAGGSCPLVCEVGVGSGVVLAFAAAQSLAILGRTDVLILGTDINSFACDAASKTIKQALIEQTLSAASQGTSSSGIAALPDFLGVTNADLAGPLRDQVVDILIFNPPYVPAPLPDLANHQTHNQNDPTISRQDAFDRDSHLLALSYAGGEDGMEITNKLLDHLPHVLNPHRGVAYVLLCAQNKPEQVIDRIEKWPGGWTATIAGSSGKKAGWEKLIMLRINRIED